MKNIPIGEVLRTTGLLFAMAVAAIAWADTRFVLAADFQRLESIVSIGVVQDLKTTIRRLRRAIERAEDPDVIESLEAELERVIDQLCYVDREDPECD